MTRNLSRYYFSSVNFPSLVCKMRSSSFRCFLKCKWFIMSLVFLPFSLRFWPLWLSKSTSATWGYFSALYDKIMKQRSGLLACLYKDTAPTRYWLKLLCFPQHLKYRVDSTIFPQDISRICRERTPLSNGDETSVSLSDGSELHGDGKTEEIVLT